MAATTDGGLSWPFDLSTVTEWAGTDRGGGVIHMGTDFGVPQGTELRATISGRITRWNNDGLGAYVLDIVRADGLLVRNAHLSRMDVNTGDQVTMGQVIGLTGGTPGTAGAGNTTGAHLHWELRWDRLWRGGAWVDPRTLSIQTFTDYAAFNMKIVPDSLKGKTLIIARDDSSGACYLWNLSTGKYEGIDGNQYSILSTALPVMHFPNAAEFDTIRVKFGGTMSAGVDTSGIVAALNGATVNVDAIAAAVAQRIGSGGDIPATKAELLALIEANYQEAK